VARAATARATAPAPSRAPSRTAPRRAPSTPRRGTTRPAPRRRIQPRPVARRAKIAARLAAIPQSPFVDRLLTGRAWIVLLAVLLAGIVFANVALLEMNAGIARTTEQVAVLKRENSRLRLEAARLGSSERIQRAAADLGLVLPAPGEVRYLEAGPEDPALALKKMTEPAALPVVAPPPVEPLPTTPVTTTDPMATETAPVATTIDPVTGEPVPATTTTTTPPATTTAPATTTGEPGY
jgi:cell division protein FtsL